MDRTQRVRWMPQQPDTRWSHLPGEPYAVKVACPVREEAVGNVPQVTRWPPTSSCGYLKRVLSELRTQKSLSDAWNAYVYSSLDYEAACINVCRAQVAGESLSLFQERDRFSHGAAGTEIVA